MFYYTRDKALIWSVVAIICAAIHFSGLFGSIGTALSNFFGEYDTYVCYTDLPNELITQKNRFSFDKTVDEGMYLNFVKEINNDVISDGMAFTLATNKNIDSFENHVLAGFYSTGFLIPRDSFDVLTYSSSSSLDAGIIDFNKILKGFIEDKNWKDIGYDLSGKITIKSMHPQNSGIFYDLVEIQLLNFLTGEKGLTEEMLLEYQDEIDEIFKKMDSCIEDENTIFICSEQSEKIDKNFNSGKYAYVSASVVSAIPVYASWNNERYNTTPQEVAEDYFSATFYLKMRNATNSKYSFNTDRKYAIDAIDMAIMDKHLIDK